MFAAHTDGAAEGNGIEASFLSHDRSDDDDGVETVRCSTNRSRHRRRIARQWQWRSIGPLRPGGNVRQVPRRQRIQQARTWQDGGAQRRHRQCRRHPEVTGFAIGVKGARHVSVLNRSRGAVVAGLVRMLVMSDMFRASDRGLVPTVNGCPSPCELKRYHREQENDHPVTHRTDSSGAPASPGTATCRDRGRPATLSSCASAATRRRGGPRSTVVQTSSCTRLAMLGRARGNCSRTALRSLIPSTKPTCSSSAPRSYRRATTVRRIDSGVAHSSSA